MILVLKKYKNKHHLINVNVNGLHIRFILQRNALYAQKAYTLFAINDQYSPWTFTCLALSTNLTFWQQGHGSENTSVQEN